MSDRLHRERREDAEAAVLSYAAKVLARSWGDAPTNQGHALSIAREAEGLATHVLDELQRHYSIRRKPRP